MDPPEVLRLSEDLRLHERNHAEVDVDDHLCRFSRIVGEADIEIRTQPAKPVDLLLRNSPGIHRPAGVDENARRHEANRRFRVTLRRRCRSMPRLIGAREKMMAVFTARSTK